MTDCLPWRVAARFVTRAITNDDIAGVTALKRKRYAQQTRTETASPMHQNDVAVS